MDLAVGSPPARHFVLEGCFNFRDLGGYGAAGGRRVRWRRLFRADGLHRLTATDEATIRRLGIATVIDLRTPEELQKRGSFPVDSLRVDYYHLPILETLPDRSEYPDDAPVGFMADRYGKMMHDASERISQALSILSRPETSPAVFHCAAGKDRTGILAAVLLGVLGVSDDDIVADYSLSQSAMARMRDSYAERNPDAAAAMTQLPESMFSADPENMVKLLASVKQEHGSITGFVAHAGVDGDVVSSLRKVFLEPERTR